MKVAVVLWAGAPAILRQAGEIKTLLADSAQEPAQVELWLLHHSHPPEFIPDIAGPVSGINLIAVENPPSPESILPRLEQLYHRQPVDLLLFASDGLGAELATRLAYRLNGSSCLKVEQLTIEPQTVAVDRAAYGHHMNARFRLRLKPYCLSAAKVQGRPVESRIGSPAGRPASVALSVIADTSRPIIPSIPILTPDRNRQPRRCPFFPPCRASPHGLRLA